MLDTVGDIGEHPLLLCYLLYLHSLNTGAEIDLNDMEYARGAGLNSDKGCMPGTRTEIIEEVLEWIHSPEDADRRIFLLTGVAGSGKSSIAHTLGKIRTN